MASIRMGPYFQSYMNGVGFGDVGPHLSTKTTPWLSQFDAIYLRNKFHFSEVHGSMNATGHVQSK